MTRPASVKLPTPIGEEGEWGWDRTEDVQDHPLPH